MPCLSHLTRLSLSAAFIGSLLAVSAGCSSTLESGGDDSQDDSEALRSAVTMVQALTYATQAGLSCSPNLITAGAVAMAESSLIPNNVGNNPPTSGCPNGSSDYGLWQVDTCYHKNYSVSCLKDGACNAKAMVEISANGTNWKPWSAYNSGRYKKYVNAATAAYHIVCSNGGSGAPSGYDTSTGSNPGGSSSTPGSSTSGTGNTGSNGTGAPYGYDDGSSYDSTVAANCSGVANGTYCGSHTGLNGDPNSLFTCNGGALGGTQSCQYGCAPGAGGRDTCYTPSCAGINDGAYCGNDAVLGDPNTLFRCKNGQIVSAIPCASTCTIYEPVGYDDVCK